MKQESKPGKLIQKAVLSDLFIRISNRERHYIKYFTDQLTEIPTAGDILKIYRKEKPEDYFICSVTEAEEIQTMHAGSMYIVSFLIMAVSQPPVNYHKYRLKHLTTSINEFLKINQHEELFK